VTKCRHLIPRSLYPLIPFLEAKGASDAQVKQMRDRGSDQLPALDPSIPASLDPFSRSQESRRPAQKDKAMGKEKGRSPVIRHFRFLLCSCPLSLAR